jgi:DNA-binding NarL/FixJ family response regulator
MQPSADVLTIGLLAPAFILRVGLRGMLESIPGIQIVFDGASLADLDGKPRFDVLLSAGRAVEDAEVTRFLRDADLEIGILLLVDSAPDADAFTRLGRRPWSVLSIEASADELAAALLALRAGLCSVDSAFTGALLKSAPLSAGMDNSFIDLTPREMDVLHLLARGLANKQIAAQLNMTENTVKFHIKAIFSKLDASNRAQAVAKGVALGIISL